MNIEEAITPKIFSVKEGRNAKNQNVSCVRQLALSHLRKMEPRSKNIRNDIFKTKISRAVCWIQLDLVYSKLCEIVKVADYKSPFKWKFEDTFRKIFNEIWKELESFSLVSSSPTDSNFIDFISLHFPEKKVF